jgi:hypothetical protein
VVTPHAAGGLSREAVISTVTSAAKPGDVVLVMGARDPSLSDLARALLTALSKRATFVSAGDEVG